MAAEMSFLQSLQPLALLALREAGGEGYAICDVDQVSGQRTLKFSYGEPVPEAESSLKTGTFSVAAFPLRVDGEVTGTLSFVFRGAAISPEVWALLERIAGPVEAVWQFAHIPKAYAALAARIGELEAELADSKIADRARGLLGNVSQTQGPLDILERHVEGVLRSNQLMKVLEEMSRELEVKVAERKLVTRAKAVLENLHGISEEQAHLQLQAMSRKTRKPIKDVARELIETGLDSHP